MAGYGRGGHVPRAERSVEPARAAASSTPGLRFGDHIAVLMENRSSSSRSCWAAQRSGLYYTCINWHFNADEAAYILDDCDAQVLVISDTFARCRGRAAVDKMPNVKLRLMVGRHRSTATSRTRRTRDRFPAEPLEEELEGTRMLYSSGTTGRPKGVQVQDRAPAHRRPARRDGDDDRVWGMDENAVYLSPAPLYHSAPLFYCMSTMRLGGTVDRDGAVRSRRKRSRASRSTASRTASGCRRCSCAC